MGALNLLFRLETFAHPDGLSSGVARVPCALGQEIFLCSPSTKLTEFELKNRCKNVKEAKAKHLL